MTYAVATIAGNLLDWVTDAAPVRVQMTRLEGTSVDGQDAHVAGFDREYGPDKPVDAAPPVVAVGTYKVKLTARFKTFPAREFTAPINGDTSWGEVLSYDGTGYEYTPDELARLVAVEQAIAGGIGIIHPSGDTSGATDHAAITAALAVSDVAILGAGLWINAPILLGSGQALKGGVGIDQGNPNLHLAAGSNCHMVTLDGTPARGYLIENLVLDGHREDQGAGNWDGINLTGPVHGTAFGQCAVGRVENVMVQYAKRHGLYIDDHQVENRVADFYGFSCGVSTLKATGSDLWFERITSGESGGDGIVIDATDYRLEASKSWWSGRQNAARSSSNPPTLGDGTARGLVASGSGHINGVSCQDNSGPGAYLTVESGHATLFLDGNGVGVPAEYQMNAHIGGCTDSDITLMIGHTSGHAQTTYPIAIADATVRSQVRVYASPSGAVYPTQARPGSVVNASTVLTFGPVAAGSGGGGGGGGGTPATPDADGLYPLPAGATADSDGLYPIGA